MAFFDGIKEYFSARKGKKLEKAGKLLRNPKAIREDRWAALEYLAKDVDDAAEAIPLLLQRFEYSLEHGINDTREKELAMSGIVRFGEASQPFLGDWLKQTSRIAWPIKCLKALEREQVVIDCLLAALDYRDVAFDQQAVDKNYDILCYLRDYQVSSWEKLSHFLSDADERVRFAAAEFLVVQQSAATQPYLEPFLKDKTAENRRLHQVIMQAFIERGWKLAEPKDFPDGWVTPEVRITPQGTLELMS